MDIEHKKALVVIFSLIFVLLMISTLFIAIELQHMGIASILVMAGMVLVMDIRWVLRTKNDPDSI